MRSRYAGSGLPVLGAVAGSLIIAGCAMTERTTAFRFQEATVASVHRALAAGEMTCTQLTRLYLDRIEAYNLKGPALRAIITVNPKALESRPRDGPRAMRTNPAALGPLHCVPIILKDNFNTFDMPTTRGIIGDEGLRCRPPMRSPWTACARPAR